MLCVDREVFRRDLMEVPNGYSLNAQTLHDTGIRPRLPKGQRAPADRLDSRSLVGIGSRYGCLHTKSRNSGSWTRLAKDSVVREPRPDLRAKRPVPSDISAI